MPAFRRGHPGSRSTRRRPSGIRPAGPGDQGDQGACVDRFPGDGVERAASGSRVAGQYTLRRWYHLLTTASRSPVARAWRRWGSDSSTFCQVSLDRSSTQITSAGTPAPVSWRANSRPSMMPSLPPRHLHLACSRDVFVSILAGMPGYAAECRRVRGDIVGRPKTPGLWDFCGATETSPSHEVGRSHLGTELPGRLSQP